MVIQGDIDTPLEMSSKKYVFVKNHIRDLSFTLEKKSTQDSSSESSISSEKTLKKSKKLSKNNTKRLHEETEQNDNKTVTQISQEDLEELRNVYKKCKSVLNTIESKYGHLLNLDFGDHSNNEDATVQCHCKANKKIIFDDNGEEIQQETDLENHICPKKPKTIAAPEQNLEVEYEEESTLPDDLPSLSNILHNVNMRKSDRNKVIDKIRLIKQEFHNELRFNRQSIIEKVKSNPNEVFEFKGANLEILPGYPVK